jgi:hypothetical protein
MITTFATKVTTITSVTNGYYISVLANCVPTVVMGLIEIVVLVEDKETYSVMINHSLDPSTANVYIFISLWS